MDSPYIISLPFSGSDDIGQLVVAEGNIIPFDVKRVYWTFNVPTSKIRGHHAHHQLQQLIMAVHGTIEIVIETANRQRYTFILDHPSQALYVPRMCWREIKFSEGSVLLCLASMEYAEVDYIRSYYDFVQLISSVDL